MSAMNPSLLNWKPVPAPVPVTLRGRYVTLEPLDAARHTAALWQAVKGHDELWAWLPDGPYATEADLRRAIEEKQMQRKRFFLPLCLLLPARQPGMPAICAWSRRRGWSRWATFC